MPFGNAFPLTPDGALAHVETVFAAHLDLQDHLASGSAHHNCHIADAVARRLIELFVLVR